jgi:ATP-dependent Clp protease ATP-binding subunit ClpX
MSDNGYQTMFCNFCNKSRADVGKLIVANNAGICNECIDLCVNILINEKVENLKKDKTSLEILDPVKIKQYLDLHIIGQDAAKITLSVSVVNHYKRIYFNPGYDIEKSNILMFGPTGSGKTLLARKIANYLKVPFIIADATTLTEAGYIGDDVESLIGALLAEADYDIERCEQGIIFIDEIDKIARRSENPSVKDIGGEGVQQALLKLVEGTNCKVKVGSNQKNILSDVIEINTKNILFIAAGAFAGLDKIINQRTSTNNIGFTGTVYNLTTNNNKFNQQDFIKYGMIPEFTGRFPVITFVDELDLDSMVRILIEPKNNLIKQMQFYFEIDNIELSFNDDAIVTIAEHALTMKTGARGLKGILENVLQSFLFNIETIKKNGQKTLVITKEIVQQNIN